MPTPFSVETSESQKPVLFIYPSDSRLAATILDELKENFTCIIVSDQQTDHTDTSLHRINTSSVYLLDKLVERIDYAILFLHKPEDKKIITLLAEKFEKDDTKSLVILSPDTITEFDDVLLQYKSNASLSFLIIGDVFGKHISEPSAFVSLLSEAVKNKTLTLKGNDLEPIFPVSDTDVLIGIKYALFGVRNRVKVGYLFYEHPLTLISAIHLLRRVDSELQMKYEESSTTPKRRSFEELKQHLETRIGVKGQFLKAEFKGFEKEVSSMFEAQTVPVIQDVSSPITPVTIVKKLQQHKVKKKADSVFFPIILGIVLFIASTIISFLLSLFTINQAVTYVKQNNYNAAVSSLKQAHTSLQLSRPTIELLQNVIPNATAQSMVSTFLKVENFLLHDTLTLPSYKTLAKGMPLQDFNQLISNTLFSYFSLQEISSDLESITNCPICTQVNTPITNLFNENLTDFITLLPIAPQLFGYYGEQHYLILFQNNGELRPTGGFIGSIGELTVQNGAIQDFTIQDVYELDGQLKTHVEPHFIVRRYLQPHLYLRDSNFSPNFETSASMAALLYNIESGKKVDGVLALDFTVLKRIIDTVGPLSLPEYKTTLTSENTFQFLQETIEKNFFPGSTEKRDVLNKVFSQIMLKIENNQDLAIKVGSLIPQLLKEKHILMVARDISIQSLLTANGYSNNFFDIRTPGKDQILDTFSLNEANIGVNKSNYTLSRSVSLDVNIKENEIVTTSTITFDNTGSDTKDYRSYLRILIPIGSSVERIKIDGKEQDIISAVTDYRRYELPNFKAPQGLEVDSGLESNLQSYGFTIGVPKDSKQTVEVTYKRTRSQNLGSLFTYSLLYFKQPGTEQYPLKITLHYPSNYAPQRVVADEFTDTSILFSKNITGDFEAKANFIKK